MKAQVKIATTVAKVKAKQAIRHIKKHKTEYIIGAIGVSATVGGILLTAKIKDKDIELFKCKNEILQGETEIMAGMIARLSDENEDLNAELDKYWWVK